MRTTTVHYYDDLLVSRRTVGLTIDEARGDLDRSFKALRIGSLY